MYNDIKGMIFDLDGTLLDSMGAWDKVDVLFLGKRGIAMPGDYQLAITALSYDEAAAYTKARFALEDSVDTIIAEWKGMVRQEYAHKLRLKPGAEKYLRALHGKGYKLALATGSGRELYEPALQNNGVYAFFDAFVTLEDVPRGKDFPDIYLRAAELLGLSPGACLAFEDILVGARSAKEAGMRVVAVSDRSSLQDREALKRLATAFIEDFRELPLP